MGFVDIIVPYDLYEQRKLIVQSLSSICDVFFGMTIILLAYLAFTKVRFIKEKCFLLLYMMGTVSVYAVLVSLFRFLLHGINIMSQMYDTNNPKKLEDILLESQLFYRITQCLVVTLMTIITAMNTQLIMKYWTLARSLQMIMAGEDSPNAQETINRTSRLVLWLTLIYKVGILAFACIFIMFPSLEIFSDPQMFFLVMLPCTCELFMMLYTLRKFYTLQRGGLFKVSFKAVVNLLLIQVWCMSMAGLTMYEKYLMPNWL